MGKKLPTVIHESLANAASAVGIQGVRLGHRNPCPLLASITAVAEPQTRTSEVASCVGTHDEKIL